MFNLIAVIICTIAFTMNVVTGNIMLAAINFILMIVNAYIVYKGLN